MNLNKTQSSFLAHIDNEDDKLDEWLRLTSDEIHLLGKRLNLQK
jgi:hypothetical protein